MILQRKTLYLLIALAFASSSIIACGGTDDPVFNYAPNQNPDQNGDPDDQNQNQNQANQNQDQANQNQTDPNDNQTDPDPNQTDPNDNQTDPDPNQTDPNDNQTDPNDNQTDPDPNQTDPNDNQTDPNDNQTDPGHNQTDPNDNQTDPNDPDALAHVFITEIMPRYTKGADDPGEFIELTNLGTGIANLSDCILSNPSNTTTLPQGLILAPGARALLTGADGGDAGLDNDGLIGFALGNGGTSLTLECDGEEVDSLTYTSSHVELGQSLQKDKNMLDQPNPAGALAPDAWCLTPETHQYHLKTGDLVDDDDKNKYGTPGEENVSCP